MFEKEHKELTTQIFNCKICLPVLKNDKYCKNCKDAVLDFIDKYGAGVLTNDLVIMELKREIKSLRSSNIVYMDKIEELKEELSQLTPKESGK